MKLVPIIMIIIFTGAIVAAAVIRHNPWFLFVLIVIPLYLYIRPKAKI